MRVRIRDELVLVNVLVAILILTIALVDAGVLRAVLGVGLALFFPGYALVSALFPDRSRLGPIERVALGSGLSVVVVVLTGFVHNYLPWGVQTYPIVLSLAVFIVAASVVAWVRRRRVAVEERFTVSFNLKLPLWRALSTREKVLSLLLLAVLLGVAATFTYVVATPKAAETFTEFYLLGPEGRLEGYPEEMSVGQEGSLRLAITNHEDGTATYRVELLLGGVRNGQAGPVTLDNEETWEGAVSFTPTEAQSDVKLEILLYKDGESEPYLAPLYTWVDVTE